jgi:hypothetical protein
MFNIIDTNRGEKADLVPLSMEPRYTLAFRNRMRQVIEAPGVEPLIVWCARPEDVIVGKLMAWAEGRSRRHETDIYEMMAFHYLAREKADFDEEFIDAQAQTLGEDVIRLWQAIKEAARRAIEDDGIG